MSMKPDGADWILKNWNLMWRNCLKFELKLNTRLTNDEQKNLRYWKFKLKNYNDADIDEN